MGMQRQYERMALRTLCLCVAVVIGLAAATDRLPAIYVADDGVLHIGDNGTDTHVRVGGVDMYDLQQQMSLMKAENSMMMQQMSSMKAENSMIDQRFDRLRWRDSQFEHKYKLTASDAARFDWFGVSVSADGDLLFVGAERDDDKGTDSGSVYVFERNSVSGVFEEKYKLTASDAASDDYFGVSVFVDGDLLFIGATYDDDNVPNSGSVYVFERNSVSGVFEQKYKLFTSDAASDDRFGVSVFVDGDLLFVGAVRDDDKGTDSGSVYVFEKNIVSGVFEQKYKLIASDAASDDQFGRSVSVGGDLLFVGAHRDDDKGTNSGSVYVFEKNSVSGVFEQKYKLTAAERSGEFGASVSVDGNLLFVGAWRDDEKGSVHIISIPLY